MAKKQMTITVDEQLKTQFKKAVGKGSMSKEIQRFMEERASNEGSIEARIESLEQEKKEVEQEIEDKESELQSLKDKLEQLENKILELKQDKDSRPEDFEQHKQDFVSTLGGMFGDEISSPEDCDFDYWKEKLEMSSKQLFELLEEEVSA